MSESASVWEERVKQGLFREEKFTDEMKKTVLQSADRRPRWRLAKGIGIVGALAICAAAFLLLVNLTGGDADSYRTAGETGKRIPLAYKPLEARILQKGETIYGGDRGILPGLSNTHSPLVNTGYAERISLSDVDLIEQKEVPGFGTAFLYTLKEGTVLKDSIATKHESFGMAIDGVSPAGTLYHYGTGHMYELQTSMTRLFGQEVLKFNQPLCRTDGEGCAWYVKKDANGLSTYATFSSLTYERDLDGDGSEEAIVVTHKQNQIYIFKEDRGALQWVSVREALGAVAEDAVAYDELLGTFELHGSEADGSGFTRTYRYGEDNKLVEVVK
ncbi:hypothetical protein B1A99_17165 [Cohnella sp. CIP 111063]|uniref:hypothetical protein n=1 Tax=unclassified Cohnella TaxID=2636738 RepID=UPI000B8C184E|nr:MULTISPECIES: hypothetical protein [unclassified Cohnella]OXS57219.1 hypothetical protein B1A99_17165 [Cohnella sp. CIP 111063]PRX70655.1 hypothetical protein B0G52_11121 [Cohnella sp. SGD-V74]